MKALSSYQPFCHRGNLLETAREMGWEWLTQARIRHAVERGSAVVGAYFDRN